MSLRRIVSREVIYTNLQERVTIYRAVDESGETLCLKEHRFQNEGERNVTAQRYALQQSLQHGNVCKVYESYPSEHDGDLYLNVFLEWCGRDLDNVTKSMLKEKVQWTVQDCFSVLYYSVSALSFAQQVGVCHRDLKPSNIFLSDEGVVKVGDFGCAKKIEEGMMRHTMAGTPLFLSPVLRKVYTLQLMGERVEDPVYNPYKSDVYSLGLAILYLLKPQMLSSLGNQSELAKIMSSSEMDPMFQHIFPQMLAQEEEQRMDFVELEVYLQQFLSASTPGAEVPIAPPEEEVPVAPPEVPAVPPKEEVSVAPPEEEVSVAPPEVPVAPPEEEVPVPKQRKIRIIKRSVEEPVSAETQSGEDPVCKGCQRTFKYDSAESWRLDMYGSTEAVRIKDYCSRECFQGTSDREPQREAQPERAIAVFSHPAEAQDEREFDEFAEFDRLGLAPRGMGQQMASAITFMATGMLSAMKSARLYITAVVPFLHCLRHKRENKRQRPYSSPTLLACCQQCPKGEWEQLQVPQVQVDFVKNSLYSGIAFMIMFDDSEGISYFPVSIGFVEKLARGTCHLCQRQLVPEKWVAFSHGEVIEVVCSLSCFSVLRELSECPACQGFIAGECLQYIIEKSREGMMSLTCRSILFCAICGCGMGEVTLECKDCLCKRCVQLIPTTELEEFGCLACGLPMLKRDYSHVFSIE